MLNCFRGGGELCAPGGEKGGDRTQIVAIKTFFPKEKCQLKKPNCSVRGFFVDFYLDPGKKNIGPARGVNKVSCRRGFELCPSGGGVYSTLPPHSHV